MNKKLLVFVFGIIFLFGMINYASADWIYVGNLSDTFSDSSINATLWDNTAGVTERIGNISMDSTVTNPSYLSTDYDFNTSSDWRIDFNWSTGAAESFIAVCNRTSSLTWGEITEGGGICPAGTSPLGIAYFNGINLLKTEMYIIINSSTRNITLYNWNGNINSTINLPTLNKFYFVFGSHGISITYLYSSFRVYRGEEGGPSPGILNVILDSPTNNTLTSSAQVNFSAHYTYSNMNISNATYYIYNQNGSIFNRTTVSVLSSLNSTNLTIYGLNLGTVNKWNIYACGTNATTVICSWGNTGNFTLTIVAFSETNVSYNNSIYEMKRQNFTLVVNGNPAISSASANFWYNGTMYGSSVTDGTAGIYRATNLIYLPLQENIGGTGNKSFLWEWTFTLTNGNTVKQNSTTYSQEVNRTYLAYCNASYPTQFINFTSRSAVNPFPKTNATFKAAWNYGFNTEGVRRSISYEDVSETLNNWTFCMSPSYEGYYVSANIEYDANGYAQNFYYLDNALLTNNTNAIQLYLLNDSLATVTEIITQDNIQNAIANVTFQIQLYDVGTDTFYTIGMGKTSWNGKDITYLNWYSTLYKFIFSKNGVVLKTTEPYKISSTPQTFIFSESTSQGFEKFRDFVYSLYYNNATQNFVLTFTKPNGLVDQGCLRVTKRTSYNDTEICLVCESSSSATLYCNIGSSGNGTFIAHFYATGSWYDLDWIETTIGGFFAETIYDLLGNEDATAYAFFFSGIVVSMFFLSPVLAIIGLILGILGGAALGFTILNYTTFIGIAIVGGVIIWFVKR